MPKSFQIDFELVDLPVEERIEIRYHNDQGQTVCLLPEFWPNKAGKIHQASDRVFLVVENQRFPIADFNTGYCPKCVLKVKPGDTVRASMSYSSFGVPEYLFPKAKQLVLNSKAFVCK